MSTQEVDKVESVLIAAEEVICALYFSNGWWQLRELDTVCLPTCIQS